jgi:hypothetical protein
MEDEIILTQAEEIKEIQSPEPIIEVTLDATHSPSPKSIPHSPGELDLDISHFKKHPWWKDCNLVKINIILFMIICYFFAELIVGILANSLTLIADSFHMISDGIGLVIGGAGIIVSALPRIFSCRIKKPPKLSRMDLKDLRSSVGW